MSKIGSKPIQLPQDVTVTVNVDAVVVKGPKGELTAPLLSGIKVSLAEDQVIVERNSDEQQIKAFHGLVRSLINNSIVGVTQGYKKTLKMVGTGYRVAAKGKGLTLSVGFSHPVMVPETAGIVFTLEGNDTIHVEGIDKHLVGQVSANVRAIRPPEPYNGKGIRYVDEVVQRKQGKAAAK